MGIDHAIDITAEQHTTVLTLLERHLPGTAAWVYGSRARWTSRPDSDLDLVVFAKPEQNGQVASLKEAFEQSDLPFQVDLFVWEAVPESFRDRIEMEHVVLKEPRQPKVSCWQTMALGDCTVVNDSTYQLKEKWPFVNYLDTGSITENRVAEIQNFTIGKDKLPSRARRKVKRGDIVYSTVRPNQRHFGILKEIPENFLVSTGFAVIRGREELAHTHFIYWLLTQDSIVNHLHAIAEHSTSAYPSIRPADIERLQICLPPLNEQRNIAHILGALDDKIDLNRRMNETLEAMARALFKSWFVDFDPVRARKEGRDTGLPRHIADLFPDRFIDSELSKIPHGWAVSRIGDEVDAVGGGTPNTKEPTYWADGIHNWATPKDLSNLSSPVLLETSRKITDAGVKKISSGILPIGTVLLSSRAPIGYLAITETPVAVNQGFIAMVCRKKLPNKFVLYWCGSNLEHIKGISGGTTFSEINKKVFRPIPVVVPPKDVLASYEGIAGPLHDRIVANLKENISLVQIRDFLLPKLISGNIRLSCVERSLEVAS